MSQNIDIKKLNARIERHSAFVDTVVMGMNRNIVGQKHLIDSLLIGLLSDGHILLEGVPGLAKTLAIKTLAQLLDADFKRIQFTPDLLPADVVGTLIYNQKNEEFTVKRGPVFSNFILADESFYRRRYLQAAFAVLGYGNPEPDRAGGYIPTA